MEITTEILRVQIPSLLTIELSKTKKKKKKSNFKAKFSLQFSNDLYHRE